MAFTMAIDRLKQVNGINMRFCWLLVLCSVVLGIEASAQAQNIKTDGSTSSLVINGNTIVPNGRGTVRGSNLYHSFERFNVPEAGVTFGVGNSRVDGSSIRNIINRVSGDSPSAIFGRIQSSRDFPNANFFLINPNGIVFGSNASLDLGKSFYATTAPNIGFSGGEIFSSDPRTSTFPNTEPINLQFAVERPAAIINQGNLSVKSGENISLIAGSVVSTGRLTAPNGSVDLGAIAGNNTVVLRSPGLVTGFTIGSGTLGRQWTGNITELPQLASLLTGNSNVSEARQVVLNPNGSLQLLPNSASTGLATILSPTGQFETTGRLRVNPGDLAIKSLTTANAQAIAQGNIALLVPNLETQNSLTLRAGQNITVRDSLNTPAVVKAGGNLLLEGTQGIDILALNHPQQPIQSGGVTILRSNGNILADAFFDNSQLFALNLSDRVSNLFSAIAFRVDPRQAVRFDPNPSQESIQNNIRAHRNILAVDSRAADVVKTDVKSGNDSGVPLNTSPTGNGSETSNQNSGNSQNPDQPQRSTTAAASPNSGVDLKTASEVAIQAGLSNLSSLSSVSNPNSLTGTASLSSAVDLLLREGRILEARQTLDLAIVKELDGYLGNVTAPKVAAETIASLTAEQQQLYVKYNQMEERSAQIQTELNALQRIPESQRNAEQVERIKNLQAQQIEDSKEFKQFINSPNVAGLAKAVSEASLKKLQSDLRAQDRNAVLLYPLIQDDRLELILVTSDAEPIRRTARVSRAELTQAIKEFRNALETVYDPSIDAKKSGQKLYNWLIQPVADELDRVNAKTILYAPYGQLRYVPLAALYNGREWLVQKYRINNITAASLQDFSLQAPTSRSILAGAATRRLSFKIGDRPFSFSGLPFARREVEALTQIIPDSVQLLDADFSPESTQRQLGNHSLVHMATHAVFMPGKPEDSFILFGNGDRLTLADVRNWSLKNVDLVVLSACDTAQGETLGNGEEILGFGYLMQQGGARAAIASLWAVDDGGTQALMDIFYTMLKRPNMTKAEALRQAQIALITGNYDALGSEGNRIAQNIANRLPVTVTEYLDHPYYWAPFIMIGNGL
jgi:filamentous hemagglutinin family protein